MVSIRGIATKLLMNPTAVIRREIPALYQPRSCTEAFRAMSIVLMKDVALYRPWSASAVQVSVADLAAAGWVAALIRISAAPGARATPPD